MNRTVARLCSPKRYDRWPWPTKLPLKEGWFHKLPRNTSLAQDTRRVLVLGDLAVVSVLLWGVYRVYFHHVSGAEVTGLRHLNNHPPAIVAHEFDFADASKNRTLSRAELDKYRAEYAEKHPQGEPITSFIFNY